MVSKARYHFEKEDWSIDSMSSDMSKHNECDCETVHKGAAGLF